MSSRDRLRERAGAVVGLERVTGDLLDAAARIASCFRHDGKVLTFGNGGSQAQAQHLAAEFVGCFSRERRALPVIALAADGVMLTSLANDFGFDRLFARQIEALGKPGDIALVISTSGTSRNTLEGVESARSLGLVTVGLVGQPGSDLHRLVDVPIVTPAPTPARVQELQLIVGHLVCEAVEKELFATEPEERKPAVRQPLEARAR